MKLHSFFENIFLIILTAFVTHEAEVIDVLINDEYFNFGVFKIALMFYSIATSMFIYYIVWCSWVKGINSDKWEEHNPYPIYIATFSLCVGVICSVISFWSVYGWYAIPLVLMYMVGFVSVVSLLPPYNNDCDVTKKNNKLIKAD